jgi:hypothetical protein
MIKFVLIILFTLQAPGEDPVTARVIYTDPYETRAACYLSGEVEIEKSGDIAPGMTVERADILCEPLEWWE